MRQTPYNWKVVPLCAEQLMDIDPKDVIPGNVFRLCDVYKSGGGYDKFPLICEKRTGRKTNPRQFVVQLYGCHLQCSYCYVTPSGIWNKPLVYTTDGLAKAFFTTRKLKSDHIDVFHLMGGSPALYIDHWPELIDRLGNEAVFHSDLLLTEGIYKKEVLEDIAKPNCLYAVNIKGVTSEDYKHNTNCEIDWNTFWFNMGSLMIFEVPFYITFTNPDMNHYEEFCDTLRKRYGARILEDSFVIKLIEYEATRCYDNERRCETSDRS